MNDDVLALPCDSGSCIVFSPASLHPLSFAAASEMADPLSCRGRLLNVGSLNSYFAGQ
jgi:hypothetical protein